MNGVNYRNVKIPTYADMLGTSLIEGLLDDGRTTGLCRTIGEAQQRATDMLAGRPTRGEAPDGQCSQKEFAHAMAWLQRNENEIRDGGYCARAFERAVAAGPNTVEWAIASAYCVRGWVPCS